MKKQNISAIIIAKNEELNIARCIDSLAGAVDEIIVIVDSSSSDNTLEIVQNKAVKYYIYEWAGFSKAKELAVAKTTNEWVLWIDADEALSPELNREIRIFKESSPRFAAYQMPRKANFLGKWIKHSGWYPGWVTRLFDKNKAYFNEKDVHEDLIIKGETGKFMNDIEHWTDPTIDHYFNKFNTYTSLAAKELHSNNKTATTSELIIRPVFQFLKMFFIRLGFLDGFHGFILAVFSTAYVFTKYAKLKEINGDFK